MANRCAALDSTWDHHCHYSASSSWHFSGAAAAFENEALTSALRASMSAANANASAASSSSYPTTPSSSSTNSSASELFSAGGHDALAPAPPSRPSGQPLARAAVGPRAGRVTKRKPRPSRRPPVTYITAEPANFRRMVQEITGFPVTASSSGLRRRHQATDASEPARSCWPAAPPPPACALPTLDTSAFLLLDRAVAAPGRPDADDNSSSGGGASPAMAAAVVTAATAAVEDGNDDTSVLLELEAMACAPALVSEDFQTLESWGII